jgi:Flp pilus assembly protein TadG
MQIHVVRKIVGHLLRCRNGNFAMIFALMAPLIMGLTGGLVDFYAFERHRTAMQDAADAVVLAATNEASVQDWSPQAIQSIAENYVQANLAPTNAADTSVYKVIATPDREKREVSVTISADQKNYFFLGYFTGTPQIVVNSVAKLSGETPVCLLALEEYYSGATTISGTSTVSAKGCAAHSNSESPMGVDVSATSKFETASTCTHGGFRGPLGSYSPTPTVDCPILADPLADRIPPTVGPCDHNNFVVKKIKKTLDPGVYCGGIFIQANATVTLNPGVYIINGGEFKIAGVGSLTGKGVTIYFTGKDGRFNFDGSSTVSLEAPEAGPTAGLLFFQDRTMALAKFEISSKKASQLLGTIYLPNGHLIINANNKIAEISAFTVIVARYFQVGAQTQLYLNSNYSATTVPVPNGLGSGTKQIRLIN